jgi:transcriptional regulator with XRE-family HTH domain
MRKASSKDEYNYYSVFPTRLRGLLEQANIKQGDLASFCSVQRQSVAQWKDGNTRPDILSLRKIAEFFNVSADYLLGISDNPTNDKDLNAVCEYIGLEQNATKKIKAISQKKTLSAILESDYFSKYVEALEATH